MNNPKQQLDRYLKNYFRQHGLGQSQVEQAVKLTIKGYSNAAAMALAKHGSLRCLLAGVRP